MYMYTYYVQQLINLLLDSVLISLNIHLLRDVFSWNNLKMTTNNVENDNK